MGTIWELVYCVGTAKFSPLVTFTLDCFDLLLASKDTVLPQPVEVKELKAAL